MVVLGAMPQGKILYLQMYFKYEKIKVWAISKCYTTTDLVLLFMHGHLSSTLWIRWAKWDFFV